MPINRTETTFASRLVASARTNSAAPVGGLAN